MRKGTKFLMTASMFAVMMNMNGCGAYGPPPEEFEPGWNMVQPAYGVPYDYEVPTASMIHPTEMDWYKLTKRRYAVIRLISVPKEEFEKGEPSEHVICNAEVLSYYDGEGADLSTVSMISLRREDLYLFSDGDVLFAELGPKRQEDDKVWYMLRYYGAEGPIYTPFTENQLILTQEFKTHEGYNWLWNYNAMIEWNRKEVEAGREAEFKHESPYFEEGVTTEDVAIILDNLKAAKEEYEVTTESESVE